MESPPPAPSAAPATAATSPRPPIAPSKLRLMCSYGGHIVPRPHDKSLFYASGETRIVALDRRTTASSLSALTAHLSRVLFHNRPFHLKYQLPNEDLDSLISVITDEDLSIMLEEHDRIAPPARIRLFLFHVKPESLGSTLLDPKSDTWFSDALKNTRILQKGQSADSGLLMGLGPELEAPVESRSNSGGKLGAESLTLETSSSFCSTNSSFSLSNSPALGVGHCDEKGLNLLDRKVRVPSSASLESENSFGSTAAPPKNENLLEPLIQVGLEESSESTVSDPALNMMAQKTVQVIGYPLPQPLDGVKQQYETQLVQGGLHYMPPYTGSVPISPYYSVYQLPMAQTQQQQHIPSPQNQPYPIYFVPMQPTQYHNLSMQSASFDPNATISSSQHPVHPQTGVMTQSMARKDIHGTQITESAAQVYCSVPAAAQMSSVPSNQGELVMELPELQIASEPVATASAVPTSQGCEFNEDAAYNQIYKTQPLPPVLPSQFQTMTKGKVVVSEASVQLQPNLA